ncbi:MAG TPA: ATP-binding protein, partial [Gaiellaceae bacterium]|nr:ATP-binding protein [Gaiellaceae bacterium]
DAFAADVCILLQPEQSEAALKPALLGRGTFVLDERERALATQMFENDRERAGLGTDTSSSLPAIFLLLRVQRGKLGVLIVRPQDERRFAEREQLQLVEAFAVQIALAIEQRQLAEAARRAQLKAETEQLRSSLLSSVSHDLRTPLGVITGATSTLLEDDPLLDPAARRDLLETAYEESERLGRLVRNLLDMTQLSAGVLSPRKEWHPIHDVVGVALNRMEKALRGRAIEIDLPSGLPPVPLDAVLVEQVIVNLLENAARYTPPGEPIDIRACVTDQGLKVTIGDRGPGVPVADSQRIFEKFCRSKSAGVRGGAGLGLAICRGVIEAHGGRIWVEDRPGGGANFHFTLPIDDLKHTVANDILPWAS